MSSTVDTPMFIAILLYESSSPDPSYTPTYEECFVLLRAENDERARSLAEEHSRARETCFQTATGQTVHWKLKRVVDVSRVLSDVLDHGAEIYARHFKNFEAYHAFEPLLGGSVD